MAVVEVGPLVLDNLGVRGGLRPGLTPVTQVDRTPNAVRIAIGCRGVESTEVGQISRVKDEAGFFPSLAGGGLQRGLSRLDLAAWQDDVISSLCGR
mgnify:CR=1 FL=1